MGSILGVRWWQFQSTHVSTDNAQIKGHLSPISAKVPATVQQVLVHDGDYVEAGQTLLILEDQDLNLKVQQAEANLATAQAALRSARDTVTVTSQTNPTQVQQAQSSLASKTAAVGAAQANVNQALAKVDTDRAGVTQAQTAVNQAQTDLRRYQLLYNEGAIPSQQLDTARTAYENAQAELMAANKTVAQAQVDANFKETALGKLQIGEKADVEVDAYPGETFHATIAGISPATGSSFALIPPDNATGNFGSPKDVRIRAKLFSQKL